MIFKKDWISYVAVSACKLELNIYPADLLGSKNTTPVTYHAQNKLFIIIKKNYWELQ